MINLEDKYLASLKNILKNGLGKTKCEVLLFGSRASGKNNKTSDIDIVVKSQEPITALISYIKELFEESNIPYKVDVLEYHRTGETLRKNIDKEGVLVWKN
jgi:type I restriction enzyme S subunit